MSKSLIPVLQESQVSVITAKTPNEFIKTRPGRGGKNVSYVEVGYVVNQLNRAFTPLGWDWKIIEQQIANSQVWVKGELVIKLSPDFAVTKSAYGGSEIKLSATTGKSLDIADDLKAASSDALKKAASLLGIASDVYYPQLDMNFSEGEVLNGESSEARQVSGNCTSCGVFIASDKIKSYSLDVYGKVLCLDCQKLQKAGSSQEGQTI